MTVPGPDPHAVILDAISTSLNAAGYWLPIEGKRAVVDAVLKARIGEGADEETPLQAARASIDLRDAVIAQLKLRTEIAEAKARELEDATDVAVRAIPLMNAAGAERDAARARLAAFAEQVQAITDEARGGIRQQLGDALATLDLPKETS
ncbi:hypothetical protein [Streptomyces gardneri]|uniref:hypothetical protein n=1 Tax=Streptomyces gardneri TaxID=66892 RepID=UPI0035D5E804